MPDTEIISTEDFRALLVRLRDHDLGDWSRGTIERIAAAEGWTIGAGDHPRLTTPPPLLGGSLDKGYREITDFQELALTVAQGASAEDFHRLVEVGTEVIGHEPPLWGGPGPFVRWREDGHPGTSTEIGLRNGRIMLTFYATGTYEYYWVKSMEWGEGVHDPFPSWMVSVSHPSLGGMTYPGGRVVFSWEEFEEALGNMIHALAHDLPALGHGMGLILSPGDDEDRYVRFLVDEDDGALVMEASAELDPADLPDEATMEGFGWRDRLKREPHNWWKALYRPSREESAAAARTLVRTLRAYGVELLDAGWSSEKSALTYFPNYVSDRARGYFDLWGLYLPRPR